MEKFEQQKPDDIQSQISQEREQFEKEREIRAKEINTELFGRKYLV